MNNQIQQEIGRLFNDVVDIKKQLSASLDDIDDLLTDSNVKKIEIDLDDKISNLNQATDTINQLIDQYKELFDKIQKAELVGIQYERHKKKATRPVEVRTLYFAGALQFIAGQIYPVINLINFTWDGTIESYNVESEAHYYIDDLLPANDVNTGTNGEECRAGVVKFASNDHRMLWIPTAVIGNHNEARYWTYLLPDPLPEFDADTYSSFNPQPISNAIKDIHVIGLTPEGVNYNTSVIIDAGGVDYAETNVGDGSYIVKYNTAGSVEHFENYLGGVLEYTIDTDTMIGEIDTSGMDTFISTVAPQYVINNNGVPVADAVYGAFWQGSPLINFDFHVEMTSPTASFTLDVIRGSNFTYNYSDSDGNSYLYTAGNTTKSGPDSALWVDYDGRYEFEAVNGNLGIPTTFTLLGESLGGSGAASPIVVGGSKEFYQRAYPDKGGPDDSCQPGKILGTPPPFTYSIGSSFFTWWESDYPPTIKDALNTIPRPFGNNTTCDDVSTQATKTFTDGTTSGVLTPTDYLLGTLPLSLYYVFEQATSSSQLCDVAAVSPIIRDALSSDVYAMSEDAETLYMFLEDVNDDHNAKCLIRTGASRILDVFDTDNNRVQGLYADDGRAGQLGWLLVKDDLPTAMIYYGINLGAGLVGGLLGLTKADISQDGTSVIINLKPEDMVQLPYSISGGIDFGILTFDVTQN